MKKNLRLTILVAGAIAIALTVLLYVLLCDNIFEQTIQWLSLMLILIAEIIAIVKALFTPRDLINQTILYSSAIHIAATVVLALPFLLIFKEAFKTYIILNVMAIAVMAVADVVVLYFGKNAVETDRAMARSQGVMRACGAKADAIIAVYGDGAYSEGLNEISEMIKYSDNSELTGDEATVMDKLEELETGLGEGAENIADIITEIKNVLKIRTITVKNNKRGGY